MTNTTAQSYFIDHLSNTDIANLMREQGFSGQDLYDLKCQGLYDDTIKLMVATYKVHIKDIQNEVALYDQEKHSNLNSFVHRRIANREPDQFRMMQRTVRSEVGTMVKEEKLPAIKRELVDHLAKSYCSVRDSINQVIYCDYDLKVFHNNPTKVLTYYQAHKTKIDNCIKQHLGGLDVTEVVQKNGKYLPFTNNEVNAVRFFIRQQAVELHDELIKDLVPEKVENVIKEGRAKRLKELKEAENLREQEQQPEDTLEIEQ